MNRSHRITALALLAVLALGACSGGDDSDDSDGSSATTAAATETTEESTETTADDVTETTEESTETTAAPSSPEPSEEDIQALCDAYRPGLASCAGDMGPANLAYGLTLGDIRAELVLFQVDAAGTQSWWRSGSLFIDMPAGAAAICDVEVTVLDDATGAEMFGFSTGDNAPDSTCAPDNSSFTIEFPNDLVVSPGDTFTLRYDGQAAGDLTPIE